MKLLKKANNVQGGALSLLTHFFIIMFPFYITPDNTREPYNL